MSSFDHPFILRMKGVSQDKKIIYMYLEYEEGGDLMQCLNKCVQMSKNMAKFYISQVICCLDYLHHRGVVYRDLKPENILLSKSGYIKMADFGFVKKID